MEVHGVLVPVEEGRRINKAINVMSDTIESELEKGGDEEARELWQIHHETLNKHFENGGKSVHKKVPVHPVLLSWSIGFLAKTSASIYKEVAKIMLLPDISHVYKESAKLVSRNSDKAYSLHIAIIENLARWAKKESWTANTWNKRR